MTDAVTGSELAYLRDITLLGRWAQVFPDEFHLQSLDKLDAALGQLQPGVAVGTVLTHLMTRLARYVADDQQVLPAMEEAKVFQKLSEAVRKASTLEATATVAELVALYHALVTFVLQVCVCVCVCVCCQHQHTASYHRARKRWGESY
jgi:hypothetical protein